jgi:undecaprenyl-diphosphatase
MIVLGTIPVGLTGLLLEHTFRTVLGRPVPAAIFLTLNGAILYGAELLRRRAGTPEHSAEIRAGANLAALVPAGDGTLPTDVDGGDGSAGTAPGPNGHGVEEPDIASDHRIARRSFVTTTLIACAQILALLPGISRSGVTMAAGLSRGLSHEDSARFSFLLATPVILAAGVLKVPDLFGPLGTGIHGQVLAGSLAAGVCAYLSVRFLTRYFETRTLLPFAIYCAAGGLASLTILALR